MTGDPFRAPSFRFSTRVRVCPFCVLPLLTSTGFATGEIAKPRKSNYALDIHRASG